MRKKKQSPVNGKVYIGARVPLALKDKLTRRALREHRSEAAIIELLLARELVSE